MDMHVKCGALAAALTVVSLHSARADQVEDFYRGKIVTLIVATSPGGDYDSRARLLARYMEKRIPGTPKIIVQNMPGAGGLRAANYLYNAAAHDGTVLASLNQQMPLTQALGTTGVEFDLNKCAWIGNTMSSPIVLVSWHKSPAKTFAEAMERELVLGGTGAGSASVQVPLMLNSLVGTKFKVIPGYPGGSEIYLAMEKGEVDGRATQSWAGWKSQKPDWIRDKKINLLAQGGTVAHSELASVPLLVNFAKTAEDRQVLEIFFAGDEISRFILAGPGIPPERVAALRKAFDDTMADAEFQDTAKRAAIDIEPTGGAEVEKLVGRILNAPSNVIEKAKRFAER
jgi:tripartite-type tricarboxylate transporter receptor subunit TctC